MGIHNYTHYAITISFSYIHTCRQNLERTEDFCKSPQRKRMIHDNWKGDPGCKEQLLFTFPIDHVIVDELHLLLGITDRLEAGVGLG